MTSTSFNIGLNTASRNSSKVLKPPGGGSSDIFGVGAAEPAEPQKRTKNHSHLSSSIFGEESTPARNKAESNSTAGDAYKAEAVSMNGTQSSTTTSTTSSAAPTPSAPATSGRTRVPPGGFSSGLW